MNAHGQNKSASEVTPTNFTWPFADSSFEETFVIDELSLSFNTHNRPDLIDASVIKFKGDLAGCE